MWQQQQTFQQGHETWQTATSQGSTAAKRGCEVVSSSEVVRDFLQNVALELGGEEPW